MKPYCVNIESGELVSLANNRINIQPGDAPPKGLKVQYLPRIRCLDCPRKLYTAVKDRVVDDFEVHLKNKMHKEQVMKRGEEREESRPRDSRR